LPPPAPPPAPPVPASVELLLLHPPVNIAVENTPNDNSMRGTATFLSIWILLCARPMPSVGGN
jgi:hypothetical protein